MSAECVVFEDLPCPTRRTSVSRSRSLFHTLRLCRIAKALGRPCRHATCQQAGQTLKRKNSRSKLPTHDVVRKHLDVGQIGETLYVCAAAMAASHVGIPTLRYRKLPLQSEGMPPRTSVAQFESNAAAALMPCYHKFTMPRSRKRDSGSKKGRKTKKRPSSIIGMFTPRVPVVCLPVVSGQLVLTHQWSVTSMGWLVPTKGWLNSHKSGGQ